MGAVASADTTPRCRCCGHVITSEESIAAGIGRDCRRRLRRGLTHASPTVRRIFRELLDAGSGSA